MKFYVLDIIQIIDLYGNLVHCKNQINELFFNFKIESIGWYYIFYCLYL